ncbi:MAG: T9SS type A sorting domain-containing protein, partial [Bacteroidota bacterium]
LPGELLLHGMSDLSEYGSLFEELSTGAPSTPLVLVSQRKTSRFEAIQALLQSQEIRVLPLTIGQALNELATEETAFCLAETQFLFLDNDPDSLRTFLSRHEIGSQLLPTLTQADARVAILGTDVTWLPKQLGFLPDWQILPPASNDLAATAWKSSLQRIGPGSESSLLVLPEKAWMTIGHHSETITISNRGEGHGLLLSFDNVRWGLGQQDESLATKNVGFREAHLSAIGENPFLLSKSSGPADQVVRPSTPAQMMVFPNPIKDRIHILLPGDQEGLYVFQLVDGQGKQLLSHRQFLRSTDQFVEIPAGEIPPGVYVLQIQQGEQGNVQSIQVLR